MIALTVVGGPANRFDVDAGEFRVGVAKFAEFLAGAGEDGADGVHFDAGFGADFFIGSPFQIEESNDLSLAAGELAEQAIDFFEAFNALGGGFVFIQIEVRLRGRFAFANRIFDLLAACEFVDTNPASDDCEIRSQTRAAVELSQDFVIVGDDLQHDFGCNIFDVFGGNFGAAKVGGVVDDVVNQTQIPIDKIVPRAGLLSQTALEQLAIDRCHSHGLHASMGIGLHVSHLLE